TRHTGEEEPAVSLPRDEARCVILFLIDMSGSFVEYVTGGDAKAYTLVMRALEKYSRSAAGEEGYRVVIGQLSAPGKNRALLFDGTPQTLRQHFPSAGAFRDFLLSKSDPNGSRIHEGVE